MLKRAFCSMLLAGAVAGSAFAYPVQEQSQPDQTQQQSGHEGGHRHGGWDHQDTGKRVQHLTKKLNLSSDQQTKVKGILDQQQTEFQSMHQDSSMSRQDRHAKMMDLRKSTDDQIRAVLNPDQQKKFDNMRQKQMQRMRQHQDHQQGSAPTAQPPSSEQPQ
jgi:periplasmic protein CpxP/Spy